MTACIQCAMEALLKGETYQPQPTETPEQHIARCHPDLAATQARRAELEKLMIEKFGAEIQAFHDAKKN